MGLQRTHFSPRTPLLPVAFTLLASGKWAAILASTTFDDLNVLYRWESDQRAPTSHIITTDMDALMARNFQTGEATPPLWARADTDSAFSTARARRVESQIAQFFFVNEQTTALFMNCFVRSATGGLLASSGYYNLATDGLSLHEDGDPAEFEDCNSDLKFRSCVDRVPDKLCCPQMWAFDVLGVLGSTVSKSSTRLDGAGVLAF